MGDSEVSMEGEIADNAKLDYKYLKFYLYKLNIISNNKYKYSKTKNIKYFFLYYILYII